jgi:hypothetical protein
MRRIKFDFGAGKSSWLQSQLQKSLLQFVGLISTVGVLHPGQHLNTGKTE